MSSSPKETRITFGSEYTILEDESLPGGSYVVDSESLAHKYFQDQNSDSGLLPPVVRYVSPDFCSFIVERPPTEVNIKFRAGVKGSSSGEITYYTLQMPWLVYCITFTDPTYVGVSSIKCYARNQQIYSEGDTLHCFAFPNTGYAEICTRSAVSAALSKLIEPDPEPAAVLNTCIAAIWDSEFNMDMQLLMPTVPGYIMEKMISTHGVRDVYTGAHIQKYLETWASLSQGEVLDMELPSGGMAGETTVGSAIQILENLMEMRSMGQIGRLNGIRPFFKFIQALAISANNGTTNS